MAVPIDPKDITEAFESIGFDAMPDRSDLRLYLSATRRPIGSVMIDFGDKPDRKAIDERLVASVSEEVRASFWAAFDAL